MIQAQIQSLAKTPDPIIPENSPPPKICIIHDALTWVERYWRRDQGLPYPPMDPQPYEIPPEIEVRIDRSIKVLPLDVFEREVKNFLRCLKRFKPNKPDLLDALATALEPTRYLHLFKNPGSLPAIEIEKPKKQPTPINLDLKNLPSIALVKHYALVRKTTVFDFILEQSGSLSFAKVHDFIQHHENYKLSSRGKGVYDGSFAWIARELEISLRTVWGAFHWMAERKLVTKIAPQDHRIKKNSRWYVCTSMAQNLKLWSMAFSDQKKHLQDSPR